MAEYYGIDRITYGGNTYRFKDYSMSSVIDDTAGDGDTDKTWSADKLITKFNDVLSSVYPVGSIYMSVVSTSPATLFGGTWEQLKDRFLLGTGDTYSAGSTGGASSVSYTPSGNVNGHTLTTNEIPSHNHSFTGSAVTSSDISADHYHSGSTGDPSANHTHSGPSHSHGPANMYAVTAGKHGHSVRGYRNVVSSSGGNAVLSYTDLSGDPASSNSPILHNGDHTHTINNNTDAAGSGQTGTVSSWHTHSFSTGLVSSGHTHSVTASGSVGNSGGGESHSHGFSGSAATINTMPPYLSVYMWKRTA